MTAITGGLISLEYAAAGLNFTDVGATGNATRDADLTTYVQAATRVINKIIGADLQASITQQFDGGRPAIVLPHFATSITSVTENGVVTTDYLFDSTAKILYAGLTGGRYWATGYRLNVSVTFVTGFAVGSVPAEVQLACRELVRIWWQQGKAAQRPQFGDQVDTMPAPNLGIAIPKRITDLLLGYPRLGGFA